MGEKVGAQCRGADYGVNRSRLAAADSLIEVCRAEQNHATSATGERGTLREEAGAQCRDEGGVNGGGAAHRGGCRVGPAAVRHPELCLCPFCTISGMSSLRKPGLQGG